MGLAKDGQIGLLGGFELGLDWVGLTIHWDVIRAIRDGPDEAGRVHRHSGPGQGVVAVERILTGEEAPSVTKRHLVARIYGQRGSNPLVCGYEAREQPVAFIVDCAGAQHPRVVVLCPLAEVLQLTAERLVSVEGGADDGGG